MYNDGGSAPEAERCLLNLERLVADGDVELASVSLDLYGNGFEETLDAGQAGRFAEVRDRLVELQASGLDGVGACLPGTH